MIVTSTRAMLLASALAIASSAPPATAQKALPTPAAANAPMSHAMPRAMFTLRTGIAQGKMVYIGKGGSIDGQVNPTLMVHEAISSRSRSSMGRARNTTSSCPSCMPSRSV
jgi:nitrite reductase (NO-forming)